MNDPLATSDTMIIEPNGDRSRPNLRNPISEEQFIKDHFHRAYDVVEFCKTYPSEERIKLTFDNYCYDNDINCPLSDGYGHRFFNEMQTRRDEILQERARASIQQEIMQEQQVQQQVLLNQIQQIPQQVQQQVLLNQIQQIPQQVQQQQVLTDQIYQQIPQQVQQQQVLTDQIYQQIPQVQQQQVLTDQIYQQIPQQVQQQQIPLNQIYQIPQQVQQDQIYQQIPQQVQQDQIYQQIPQVQQDYNVIHNDLVPYTSQTPTFINKYVKPPKVNAHGRQQMNYGRNWSLSMVRQVLQAPLSHFDEAKKQAAINIAGEMAKHIMLCYNIKKGVICLYCTLDTECENPVTKVSKSIPFPLFCADHRSQEIKKNDNSYFFEYLKTERVPVTLKDLTASTSKTALSDDILTYLEADDKQ